MKKDMVKTIAIVVLILVIIIGIFYLMVLPVYNQSIYNNGYNQGANDVIRNQMVTGNIALIDVNGTITTKPILDLCKSVVQG